MRGTRPSRSKTRSLSSTIPRALSSSADARACETDADTDTGTFTVTRTGDTTSPLDVNVTFSGTAADTDYTLSAPHTPPDITVTIPAGQASGWVGG